MEVYASVYVENKFSEYVSYLIVFSRSSPKSSVCKVLEFELELWNLVAKKRKGSMFVKYNAVKLCEKLKKKSETTYACEKKE